MNTEKENPQIESFPPSADFALDNIYTYIYIYIYTRTHRNNFLKKKLVKKFPLKHVKILTTHNRAL